jgi:hypothetical protein
MKHQLMYCLWICAAFNLTVRAQRIPPKEKALTIPNEDAPAHIGRVVKINYQSYKTADNGKILRIYRTTKHPEKSLMLRLNGQSRKKILLEILTRRKLNKEIKSPLDTSITAIGKIILYNGYPIMKISRASDVYLGADLKVDQPLPDSNH